MHFNQTIPKRIWHTKSLDFVFNNCNDLQTFMLLDNSGVYGVSIGINKSTKSIILNDSIWMSWNEFKVNTVSTAHIFDFGTANFC